jgi:ribosomal protein S18 acetylase RimI-like enzyme
MLSVRPLLALDATLAQTLIAGYTSAERYSITSDVSRDHLRFDGALAPCDPPFIKTYPSLRPEELARYAALAAAGHAFGGFDGERCMGLAICEPTAWNRSMTLWEAHVAVDQRRRGVGRALLAAVVEQARALGLRRVWLETQTSNIPAIRFYAALGFVVVGLDLNLYTNDDEMRGEVALFMAQALE